MAVNNLNIEVSNLGPIEHGSVSVRPLTILIGPNNTGKTYFAQVLYSVRKAIANAEPRRDMRLSAEELRGLADTLALDEPRDSLELPTASQKEAVAWVLTALADGGNLLRDRLKAYFAVPDPKQIQRWNQPNEFSVTASYETPNSLPHVFLNTGNGSPSLKPQLDQLYSQDLTTNRYPKHFIIRDIERRLGRLEEMKGNDITISAPYSLQEVVWSNFIRHIGLTGNAHYLPAGRSGLLAAWTDVVKLQGDLIRDRFGLVEEHPISLGGVALDFITASAQVLGGHRDREHHLIRSGPPHHAGRPHLQPARELLQELMGGEIHTDADHDGVPILEYRPGKHAIPVQRASSMVADLAPLAMWINNLVNRGDLLIVDEPESHLHPDAVRKLARVLVRLVNAGVGIVCATHSPVLLHEISNCILRYRVATRTASRTSTLSGDPRDGIDIADVAVYGFKSENNTSSVVVSPIEIDADWGISEDDFAQIAMTQLNDSAALHDQLNIDRQ